MTMDLHEKIEKGNSLSEVTPSVVASVCVLADPRSDLDHKEAPSCGEIGLLPPIKKIKSRKKKKKQQTSVDSHEIVEKENEFSEGTHLVVDSKSVLAGSRSDLDHKEGQLCGEAGALPPIRKNKSRERKPKKQMTAGVNPAEETTMEKTAQKQNITEVVKPDFSNSFADGSLSDLQDLNVRGEEKNRNATWSQHSANVVNADPSNIFAVAQTSDLQENVSRKKRKRNRKQGENSVNFIDPETSNMSTIAPTPVLQGLSGNIDPSGELKALMLSKDDCLIHSSNLVNLETSNMNDVAPNSDLQENISENKRKRNRKRVQNSANLVNPEISSMSTVASTSVLLGMNVNIGPSDESKGLMPSKDDCLMHSSNLVNPEVGSMPNVAPTSDSQENGKEKKKKRSRNREQNSTNLVNPETSNMSTVAPTSVVQGLNGNIGPSDESKGLMLLKDDCLMHSSNLVNPEAGRMPNVAPTSDSQENGKEKKRKRNRNREQNSTNLVNLEISNVSTVALTSAVQGLNGSIGPSDESKGLMPPKDDCLMHSSNFVNPEAGSMPNVAPASDSQENGKEKKRKRNKNREQNSTNLVNPETSNMSTVAITSVVQGLNGSIAPSDESKGLVPPKDDCLMHSSNLVNPEVGSMPNVAPTSNSQENGKEKKKKRSRNREQNSTNLVNPETSNMSTVAPTSVVQGLNGNIGLSDESKGLMPSKDDCLMHSSNLVNPEVGSMPNVASSSDSQENGKEKKRKRNRNRGQNSTIVNPESSKMPSIAPTSDLQENVSGKKRKRDRKRGQNSAILVTPETSSMSIVAPTSVLQGLNGNIGPSDESKDVMLIKDDCLVHSSNLVNPEASSMSTLTPASVLQELNGNTGPSDESQCLILSKDKFLIPDDLVKLEASGLSTVTPTSVSQENLSRGKKKRKRNPEQHSTNLVNPDTNVLQGLTGNIAPSGDTLLMDDTVPKKDMPYVPNGSSHISSTKVLKKKLLILDLNGLLADIVPYTNKSRKHDFVLSKKYVYKRPYVEEFLNFCLEKFTVAVWSSRKKKNIDKLINFLIGTARRRKLLFCWDQHHCTKTKFNTIGDRFKKPLVLKDLRKVWDHNLKGGANWNEQYNESNTLLLDDSPYKALLNPPNTAIFPHSYRYTQVEDNSIGPGGDLQMYLEGLSLADNVQEYVRNNPFGQSPITQSHPSWDFYKVIMDLYGRVGDPLKETRQRPREWRNSYTDANAASERM